MKKTFILALSCFIIICLGCSGIDKNNEIYRNTKILFQQGSGPFELLPWVFLHSDIVDVYRMNADATDKVRLTHEVKKYDKNGKQITSAMSNCGVFSINAKQIAFLSRRDLMTIEHRTDGIIVNHCNSEVYIMNFDGTGQRRLTYDGGIKDDLSLSPNDKIAFIIRNFDTDEETLTVMNKDGSSIRPLFIGKRFLGGGGDRYFFSPNGSKIIFYTSFNLYLIDLLTNNVRKITNFKEDGGDYRNYRITGFNWLTEDKILYVLQKSEGENTSYSFVKLNVDDSTNEEIFRLRNLPKGCFINRLRYAPKRRHIYFKRDDGNDKCRIYRLDIITKDIFQLTKKNFDIDDIAVSPEGGHILFTTQAFFGDNKILFGLDSDGNNLKKLAVLGGSISDVFWPKND